MRKRATSWAGRIALLGAMSLIPIPHLPLMGVCLLAVGLGEPSGGWLGLAVGTLTLVGSSPGEWWLPAVYALAGWLSGLGEPRLGLRSRFLCFGLGSISGLLLLACGTVLTGLGRGEGLSQTVMLAGQEGLWCLGGGVLAYGLVKLLTCGKKEREEEG